MIENLTWAMIGFAAGFAIMAADKFFTVGALTKRWQEVAAKNRLIHADAVDRAYEQGYEDALLKHGLKTTPANEPTGRSEGVRATPIAQT